METLGKYSLSDISILNIDEVFKIYSSNEEYFILSGGYPATIENIHRDIKDLPPNAKVEQKQYKIIKLGKEYIGVIDYITEYPDLDVIYIGLFMIEKSLQGFGHGSIILQELEAETKKKGFKRIRLGVIHNNEPGLKFWENRGFKVIKEMYSTIHPERNWLIKVMEKEF